jgi:hypothetical protein
MQLLGQDATIGSGCNYWVRMQLLGQDATIGSGPFFLRKMLHQVVDHIGTKILSLIENKCRHSSHKKVTQKLQMRRS